MWTSNYKEEISSTNLTPSKKSEDSPVKVAKRDMSDLQKNSSVPETCIPAKKVSKNDILMKSSSSDPTNYFQDFVPDSNPPPNESKLTLSQQKMLFIMKKSDLKNVYFRYPEAYKDYENIKLNPKHLKHAIDVSFRKLKVYAVKCKEQYIDEWNDDKEENGSDPMTPAKYKKLI